MSRYDELLKLCWGIMPDRIIEIGTWNGDRAIQMCQCGASYVGFDLFEEATGETDEEEKNVKAHFTLAEVQKKLSDAGVRQSLIRGNTRGTLPGYMDSPLWPAEGPFDFAFIDGGHSLETIQSDWEHVKQMMAPGGVVVFDDYYEDFEETDKWGCNQLVQSLPTYMLLDSIDPVQGGGGVRLAVVAV